MTGRTLAEEAARRRRRAGQDVIHPLDKALKPTGGLVILKGNLAPDGCVIKVAGHKRLEHRGPARVFDSEHAAFPAVEAGKIKPGDVMVIRYEGPRGGPGMQEMLAVTAAVAGIPELTDTVALLTDGRFSGATRGLDGGPRRARGRRWRADRSGTRRRHDSFRHTEPQAGRGDFCGRTGVTTEGMEEAGAEVQTRSF